MRARVALLALLSLGLTAGRPASGARSKHADAARPPAARPSAARPTLLWPLEFDDGLAAAFGELRGDRLHTGIDLRTRGETGHAVRAVTDGEVVRVKEEWRGYGIALYLALPGGRIAVYGHLDRVASDLEKRLVAARAARGSRWAGDVEIAPGRRARRGEVIAWSGESGAGLPHLHFEIREGMDRPVDPFLAGLTPADDNVAPTADRVFVLPAQSMAQAAHLFDGGQLREYALHPVAGGFAASSPITVAGPVQLILEAYDRVGAQAKTGLGGITTRLDGREIYRLGFAAIPFGHNHTAGAVLDLARSHLSPTFYGYRVAGLAGAELPFTTGASRELELTPGTHRLEIELRDAVTTQPVRSRVTLDIVALPAPPAARLPPPPGTVLQTVLPTRAAGLSLPGFTLTIPSGAAWGAFDVAARAAPELPLPEGLAALAAPVQLAPDGHPFRAPIELGFIAAQAGSRAGVYRFDPVTSAWGLEDMGANARVRRLGTYALLEDQSAPVIESVTLEGLRLVVKVSDVGSGIPERGVVIEMDGGRVEERYDPDRGQVTADLPRPPARGGPGIVQVRASDRAGNHSDMTERRIAP